MQETFSVHFQYNSKVYLSKKLKMYNRNIWVGCLMTKELNDMHSQNNVHDQPRHSPSLISLCFVL